jgi:hypothetical protein
MDIKATTTGRKRRPFAERFWEKVTIGGDDECWEWQAARNAKGGFIADDICVLHHCDNPSCCNPAHLYAGTKKDNTRDMMQRGQYSPPPVFYGDQHWKRRRKMERENE